MRTFPKLLQLPVLAFDRVIFSLSAIEILELSQCSSKTLELLKTSISREPAVKLMFYTAQREMAECRVHDFWAREDFEICVYQEGSEFHKERAGDCEERQFLGRTWKMRKTEDEVYIIAPNEEQVILMTGWFADYFFIFFNVKPSNFDVLIPLYPEILETLKKWGGSLKAEGVGISGGDFESALFSEFLHYHGGSRKRIRFNGILTDPKKLKPAHFPPLDAFELSATMIGPELFFKLDSRVMIFEGVLRAKSLLKAEHFNMFIRKWLEDVGFQKNLEMLFVKLKIDHFHPLRISKKDLFKEIPSIPSKSRKPFLSAKHQEDLEAAFINVPEITEARDIRRSVDRKMATLIFTDNVFIFIVKS